MRTLITLVGEQTLPNVIVIRETGPYDRYCFITTNDMERMGKTDAIIAAAGIDPAACQRFICGGDSLSGAAAAAAEADDGGDYTVHLTGGTKPMMLGAYHHFHTRGARLCYMPLGKDCIVDLDATADRTTPVQHRVSVEEYFAACSQRIISSDDACAGTRDAATTGRIYGIYCAGALDPYLADLREARSRKRKRVSISPDLQRILDEASFGNASGVVDAAEINYLTGGWFEEYIGSLLAAEFDTERLRLNVHYAGEQSGEKELDAVVMHRNTLHIIECKTALIAESVDIQFADILTGLIESAQEGSSLEEWRTELAKANPDRVIRRQKFYKDTLDKATALNQHLGRPVSYLVTLDATLRTPDGDFQRDAALKMRQHGIRIIDRLHLESLRRGETTLKRLMEIRE